MTEHSVSMLLQHSSRVAYFVCSRRPLVLLGFDGLAAWLLRGLHPVWRHHVLAEELVLF